MVIVAIFYCNSIVRKVPKWDDLFVCLKTFIVINLIILNTHSHYFYMLTERRGNRQTARETEKESVRENERCGKTDIGIHHKTGSWKNPLTSFWDKLGRIHFSWETILIEERDRKDTWRLNILREIRLMTIGTMSCTFSIIRSFKKLQEKKVLWDPTLLGKEKKYLVHFKVSCWDNWRLTKSHRSFKENGKNSSPTFPPVLQNFFPSSLTQNKLDRFKVTAQCNVTGKACKIWIYVFL